MLGKRSCFVFIGRKRRALFCVYAVLHSLVVLFLQEVTLLWWWRWTGFQIIMKHQEVWQFHLKPSPLVGRCTIRRGEQPISGQEQQQVIKFKVKCLHDLLIRLGWSLVSFTVFTHMFCLTHKLKNSTSLKCFLNPFWFYCSDLKLNHESCIWRTSIQWGLLSSPWTDASACAFSVVSSSILSIALGQEDRWLTFRS